MLLASRSTWLAKVDSLPTCASASSPRQRRFDRRAVYLLHIRDAIDRILTYTEEGRDATALAAVPLVALGAPGTTMLAPIQRDFKIRGYTVGQSPNPPLWIALAALLLARLTDDGSTIDGLARATFYVALTVWAYEEAAHGVNGFRKGLGMAALGLIVIGVARALG